MIGLRYISIFHLTRLNQIVEDQFIYKPDLKLKNSNQCYIFVILFNTMTNLS